MRVEAMWLVCGRVQGSSDDGDFGEEDDIAMWCLVALNHVKILVCSA